MASPHLTRLSRNRRSRGVRRPLRLRPRRPSARRAHRSREAAAGRFGPRRPRRRKWLGGRRTARGRAAPAAGDGDRPLSPSVQSPCSSNVPSMRSALPRQKAMWNCRRKPFAAAMHPDQPAVVRFRDVRDRPAGDRALPGHALVALRGGLRKCGEEEERGDHLSRAPRAIWKTERTRPITAPTSKATLISQYLLDRRGCGGRSAPTRCACRANGRAAVGSPRKS